MNVSLLIAGGLLIAAGLGVTYGKKEVRSAMREIYKTKYREIEKF